MNYETFHTITTYSRKGLSSAVYRYISVCHPFRREKFCTTRRACIVIACLSCSVLLLHVVQAYFWHFSDGLCDIRPEVAKHVWSIWSWTTELLVFLLVPLAILVTNIRVIVARQRIAENMEKLLDGGRRSCISSVVSLYLRARTCCVHCVMIDGIARHLYKGDVSGANCLVAEMWAEIFRVRKYPREMSDGTSGGTSGSPCSLHVMILCHCG